jgi:hypothetical protein
LFTETTTDDYEFTLVDTETGPMWARAHADKRLELVAPAAVRPTQHALRWWDKTQIRVATLTATGEEQRASEDIVHYRKTSLISCWRPGSKRAAAGEDAVAEGCGGGRGSGEQPAAAVRPPRRRRRR